MNLRTPRIALLFCFLLCGFSECRNQDSVSLVAAGWTLLSPPSNLVGPGAVVMMIKDDQNRAQLQILCGPRSNLGSAYLSRVSDTMSSNFRMSRTQKIDLELDAVEKFKARTKVEDVDTVSVSLNRPKILDITEDEIFEKIDNRSQACRMAIQSRIAAGFSPTFVTSAYIADVEYTVSFKRDRELTKRIREERMGRIAANLGGGHTEITESSLKATNLVIAIRADSYLMSITPDDHADAKHVPKGPGLQEAFAEVCPEPVAPFVPPDGGWANPIIGR